jgi:hypothetical protein
MVTSIAILTEEQCSKAYDSVHALRARWIPRGGSAEQSLFFTIGTATYMDAGWPETSRRYYDNAHAYNATLKTYFGWLYELVRSALEQYFEAPTSYREDLALPGFHIWLYPGIFTQPTASVHFDLQYLQLPWQDDQAADFTQPISFTLPIKLPAMGGGLNVWELSYEEFMQERARGLVERAEQLCNVKSRIRHPYALGHLLMHSGHALHQIAPVIATYPGDERICLQGHGIRCASGWKLYW